MGIDKIRIKDIAELSGVSVGTVDRVLHNRPSVSQKAREKVEKALKEMDYHPNVYASALAYNKSYKFYCIPYLIIEGILGGSNGDLPAVDKDLAFIGEINTGDHVHQGCLAGAVLAQDGQNLTPIDRQAHVLIRHHLTAEALGDVF